MSLFKRHECEFSVNEYLERDSMHFELIEEMLNVRKIRTLAFLRSSGSSSDNDSHHTQWTHQHLDLRRLSNC